MTVRPRLLPLLLAVALFGGSAAVAQDEAATPEEPANARTDEVETDALPAEDVASTDVFDAIMDGAFLTARRLADEPATQAVAALTAARVGILPEGQSEAEVRAEARDALGRAYDLGDPPSAAWSARLASGEDLSDDDIRTIAERLARAAAAGKAEAAFLLSDLIRSIGRPGDQARGIRLLETAADAGMPDAQYRLGVLYRRGEGVDQSATQAARLLERAAEAGLPEAQVEYGLMLFGGTGVEADQAAAANLIRTSAIFGNKVAQNRLARLYSRGLGLDADPYLTAFWHLVAREGVDEGEGISDPYLDGFLASVSDEDLRAARAAAAAFQPSPPPNAAASLLAVLGWPEPI